MMNRPRSPLIQAVLVFALCAMASSVALASESPLKGKVYKILVREKGKSKDTPHTLTFGDKKMGSPECQEWGFMPGVYEVKREGKAMVFRVTLAAKKEGVMQWQGRIEGKTIRGTSVWKKAGQKDIEYVFREVSRGAATKL